MSVPDLDNEPAGARVHPAEPTPRVLYQQPKESGHLLDYLRVVYKRRWLVGILFAIGALAGLLASVGGSPEYEAKAQLLIESNEPQVMSFKGITPATAGGLGEEMFYQTQYRILQSRTLARRTLENLKLWEHPDFGGSDGGQAGGVNFSIRSLYSSAVGGVVSLFKRDQAEGSNTVPEAAETRQQSKAIDRFLQSLDVDLIRNSRLVTVAFRASSPELAARITNALTRGYIEQILEIRYQTAKEANDFIGQRLDEQRTQVEKTEQELQRYREQNDAMSLDERQNIVVQKLADLNGAVTKAKTLRIEKEALYNQLKVIQDDREALDTFPAILSDSYVQQLKVEVANQQRLRAQLAEKLGDKHPDLIKVTNTLQSAEARLRGEIGKVVQSVRNEYLAAAAQERTLSQELESQKIAAQQLGRKSIDYGVLERDAVMNRQLFDSLLQRSKETGISEEIKTSNARVVDPAEVPRSPMPRHRLRDLMVGVFGGLIIGIAFALFFEYLDNRIKTPEELRTHLGLPLLGLLPAVAPSKSEPSGLLLREGVAPALAEAVRGMRTQVLFSAADEGSRAVLVTSTQPGEGKTLVSCNLAMACAQAGQRVLLIDADMRQPKMHGTFEIRQTPGLSNLILGNVKSSEAVVKSPTEGLWLLTSGDIPPNPAELLGSRRFKDLLTRLREHFDWIIIDSPPVLAVTDAAILSHTVSDVLFVVGCEMTSRAAARQALEQLESARAHIIGGVLNRVELQRHPFFYATYSRPEYSRYYSKIA